MNDLAGMSPAEVVERFELEPLEKEGGWFRRVAEGDSLDQDRKAWSTVLALFTPEQFSALHRLKIDEVWSFLGGDLLEVVLLTEGEGGASYRLGEERRALAVPVGVWQGAKPVGQPRQGQGWSLVSCTCVPGFVWDDFELGDAFALKAAFPDWAETIGSLTRS